MAAQPILLLLSASATVNALLARDARAAGFIVVTGRYHEHGADALARVTPDLALIEVGHDAATSGPFIERAAVLRCARVHFAADQCGAELRLQTTADDVGPGAALRPFVPARAALGRLFRDLTSRSTLRSPAQAMDVVARFTPAYREQLRLRAAAVRDRARELVAESMRIRTLGSRCVSQAEGEVAESQCTLDALHASVTDYAVLLRHLNTPRQEVVHQLKLLVHDAGAAPECGSRQIMRLVEHWTADAYAA